MSVSIAIDKPMGTIEVVVLLHERLGLISRGRREALRSHAVVMGSIGKAPALKRELGRARGLGDVVALLHRQDEVLPAISTTKSLLIVVSNNVLNLVGFLANVADESEISCKLPHALETGDEQQRNETLRIHAPAEIHILAQILD